jgi:hypothetical protein
MIVTDSPQNTQHQVVRDARGRFVRGSCGNRGGRPTVAIEVKELARKHGPAAIKRLAELMKSDDEMVAVAASKAMLDRAYGRPEMAVSLGLFNGEALPPPNLGISFENGAPGRPSTIEIGTVHGVHLETIQHGVNTDIEPPQRALEPQHAGPIEPHAPRAIAAPAPAPAGQRRALDPVLQVRLGMSEEEFEKAPKQEFIPAPRREHEHAPDRDSDCPGCRRSWLAQYERPLVRM